MKRFKLLFLTTTLIFSNLLFAAAGGGGGADDGAQSSGELTRDEEKIIQFLKKYPHYYDLYHSTQDQKDYKEFIDVFTVVFQKGFLNSSQSFRESPVFIKYFSNFFSNTKQFVNSFFSFHIRKVERGGDEAGSSLKELEFFMRSFLDSKKDEKKSGCYRHPSNFLTLELLYKIYKTNNENLINLWEKYFPCAAIDLFKNTEGMGILQNKKKGRDESLKAFAKKNITSFDKAIEDTKKIQRFYRNKRRIKQECYSLWKKYFRDLPEKQGLMEAQKMIDRANTPYTPTMAKRDLALRIYELAKNVRLSDEIHHLTSSSAIKSIFDSCLYGSASLIEFYMSYKPAALASFDIHNGDSNVVCLGPHQIDPRDMQDVKLTFSYKSLNRIRNPVTFFKLRDFGYTPHIRYLSTLLDSITIKNERLQICHDQHPGFESQTHALFRIGYKKSWVEISYPISEFISYDVKNMDRIIVLMFFKLLEFNKDQDSIDFAHKVYEDLSLLGDEELLHFLKDMGEKIRMASEFNFYGAHEIDFDTLKSVEFGRSHTGFFSACEKKGFISYSRLELNELIASLNRGDLSLIKECEFNFLFNSYRFLSYLLRKVENQEASKYIKELRKKVKPTLRASIMSSSAADGGGGADR